MAFRLYSLDKHQSCGTPRQLAPRRGLPHYNDSIESKIERNMLSYGWFDCHKQIYKWNSLPIKISSSESINAFKRKYYHIHVKGHLDLQR